MSQEEYKKQRLRKMIRALFNDYPHMREEANGVMHKASLPMLNHIKLKMMKLDASASPKKDKEVELHKILQFVADRKKRLIQEKLKMEKEEKAKKAKTLQIEMR